MSNLRVPFAAAGGFFLCSAVFLALLRFVSVPLNIGDPIKADLIEFTKKIIQTPLEIKRDPKIERPPPPTLPTAAGLIVHTSNPSGPPELVRPRIELIGYGRGAIGPGRGGNVIGIDRDVMPLVRMEPEYPAHAQGHGLEGWVQIQFTVTTEGTVRDAVVVAAQPPGEFEGAALKAIARWRYNPRIDGGVAVERVGLQTVLRFELQK
jgi:protein TonB